MDNFHSLLLVGSFILLLSCFINFLLSFERIHRSSARVAAAYSEDKFFGDATTWEAEAEKVSAVSWTPARIELPRAADTTPTHSIVVIVAALEWHAATLIVDQNAAQALWKTS